MDSFGYTIFVFVPALALVLGGVAWAVQRRANRRIDALLSSGRTAGTNSTVSGTNSTVSGTSSTVFGAGPVSASTGPIGLSGNAYVVRSSPITAQYSGAGYSEAKG
jgi:uncharacterized membrane protein YdcZ (DUF606 family)